MTEHWEPYIPHQEWPPGVLKTEEKNMQTCNFKPGDKVTWGSGTHVYDYVGEVGGYHVLSREGDMPVARRLGDFLGGLRKVPQKRTVKVDVELCRNGPGRTMAYSNSEDEPGFRAPPIPGRLAVKTIEFEVDA
jgi:hypothetical protein